jgi:hypothetical protein
MKQEWATLDSEKKLLYKNYYRVKDNHKDLQTALHNAERMLGITNDGQIQEQTHETQRAKSRDHGAR